MALSPVEAASSSSAILDQTVEKPIEKDRPVCVSSEGPVIDKAPKSGSSTLVVASAPQHPTPLVPKPLPKPSQVQKSSRFTFRAGGIERGDKTKKEIALIFTGGPYSDGGAHIRQVLKKKGVQAGFFFTGDFYRAEKGLVEGLIKDGHYLGPHSDKHLQYCNGIGQKTLITKEQFKKDLKDNYREMAAFNIKKKDASLFIPPFEEYNEEIVRWSREMGVTLFNYTPGTASNEDYSTPDMGKGYLSSQGIYQRIFTHEQKHGLNGHIMLLHIGTDPKRTDKFYVKLEQFIDDLRSRGYSLVKIDKLLKNGRVK